MSCESLLAHCNEHEQSVEYLSNKMEARAEHQKIRHYRSLYAFTASVGVGLILLVLVWILHFRNGFGWSSHPNQEFYWHPFLMVLGMVFLYSQSMLVYRTLRHYPKKTLKIIHAALHFLAFTLSVIGLQAVFDSHNLDKPPKPNLYSLHSWLGLITVIIFAAQFLFGFFTFLYPGLSTNIRKLSLPVHTALGTGCFVLALFATLTGLTEKVIWTVNDKYPKYDSEGILFNFMGVFTALYGIMVLYLVSEVGYKRVALPQDEVALSHTE